jgi:hypothetical protein
VPFSLDIFFPCPFGREQHWVEAWGQSQRTLEPRIDLRVAIEPSSIIFKTITESNLADRRGAMAPRRVRPPWERGAQ